MSAATHGTTPYYFVPGPSRHPVMASFGLFFVILGAGQWINGAQWGAYSLAFGLAFWLFVLFQWFSDAVGESNGGLYGHLPPKVNNVKPAGEWNRMTVTAQGQRIKVAVNGEVTVDTDLAQWTTLHQVTFNMFQRDVFGFRDQPQRQQDKQHVQTAVHPEGIGAAQRVEHGQEGGADNHVGNPVGRCGAGDTEVAAFQRLDFGAQYPNQRAGAHGETDDEAQDATHREDRAGEKPDRQDRFGGPQFDPDEDGQRDRRCRRSPP